MPIELTKNGVDSSYLGIFRYMFCQNKSVKLSNILKKSYFSHNFYTKNLNFKDIDHYYFLKKNFFRKKYSLIKSGRYFFN